MYARRIERLDIFLILLVLGITVFGIVAIGSATRINLPGIVPSVYRNQIIWFVSGIFLMALAAAIDYEFWGRYYLFAYGAIFALLLFTLFFAEDTRGAGRWLEIGRFSIQPSEFAKVVMIFCLARLISKHEEQLNKPKILLLLAVFTLAVDFLVYKQPSLSVSLVILVILVTEVFAGGLSFKYVFAILAILLPLVTLLLIDVHRQDPIVADKILGNYQMRRILALSRPEEYAYEAEQPMKSVAALGSGQLEGKGLYHGSLNQGSPLQEQHNDFIFAVIGEEFGFIGCVAVLSVLFLIIFRCAVISYKAYDTFGRLIAAGTAGMLAFQTFVHCGVTMAFLPTTGMSLPFLSYGGSSLWTNYIAIGLVLNVGLKQSKPLFE